MTSTPHTNSSCPERTLLEDYVLGRLDPDSTRRIETHINDCMQCSEVARELKEEADHLLQTLSISRGESTGDCVAEETLALYMDLALDSDEYTRTELHLAECDTCRQRLVTLYREITTVMGEEKLPEPSGSRAEFVSKAIKKTGGEPAQNESTTGKKSTPPHLPSPSRYRDAVVKRQIYLSALAVALLLPGAFIVPAPYTNHAQIALIGAWSFFVWKITRSGVLKAFEGYRAVSFIRPGTLLLSLLLFAASFLSAPILSSWSLTASLMSFLTLLLVESGGEAGATILDQNEDTQKDIEEAGVMETENQHKASERRAQGQNR